MKTLPLSILFAWLSLWIALAYVNHHGWRDTTYERNADWYYGYADTLVSEGRYQDCVPEPDSIRCATPLDRRAYRLPGYPVFLAGVMVVGPDHAVEMVKALQAVMVAGITFMTVQLAYRIQPRHRLALVVGGLMLGARNIYYNAPLAQTETFFSFVLMVFVWAFVTRHWQRAGLLWGGTLVIRTSLIFSTPLLYLLIPRRHWLRFGAGLAVVLLPLALRNSLVLDTFAPLGSNGGTVLKAGHNPESYQTGEHVAPDAQADWSQFADLSEVELDRALRHSAITYARTHMRDLPAATVRKLWLVIDIEGVLLMVIWSMVGVLKWRRRHVA